MKAYTLKDKVSFDGIGLHTGLYSKIVVHPEDSSEISFYVKGTKIPADVEYVYDTVLSTDLGRDGTVVKTVEHIMAVFSLLNIRGVTVELLEGCEIPICDGSGGEFYRLMKECIKERGDEIELLEIQKSVKINLGDSYIEAHPSSFLRITYKGFVNYINCGEEYTYRWGNPEDIVYARTFCYLEDVETILKKGYGRGGSTDNVLIIDKEGVYNGEGLRYKDEPLRHKVFDLLGDLYLIGMYIKGEVVSCKGGHTLNIMFARELVKHLTAVRTL